MVSAHTVHAKRTTQYNNNLWKGLGTALGICHLPEVSLACNACSRADSTCTLSLQQQTSWSKKQEEFCVTGPAQQFLHHKTTTHISWYAARGTGTGYQLEIATSTDAEKQAFAVH